MSKLALCRGEKLPDLDNGNMFNTGSDMFFWPIINREMENGVLKVLREVKMSGTDLTKEFEAGFAKWHGVKYAIGHSSGTASLQTAMYAVGLGAGDEMICSDITYWASCAQALTLGASVIFADIDPMTLCINPDDIEHRITPKTKVIMVVHYLGYPADMDRIMAIAKKHNLKVIEDVSHAHGSLYKGQIVGTFGDAAGFSLMSAKSFAIGEAGMFITNDRECYERAILFAHYERQDELTIPELKAEGGIPIGGYKYRMHQMSSVVGIEMLKCFPEQMEEVNKAMNYFWDSLEGLKGIRAHRPPHGSNCTMGAWYCPHGIYLPEELDGLSAKRFCEALQAEGIVGTNPGCNAALADHRLFYATDVYGSGKPTNFSGRSEGCPVSDNIQEHTFYIPWFKKFRPQEIDMYVEKFKLVIDNYKELLPGDDANLRNSGNWALSPKKKK
jgi:dTDP-4-amino-4,6-dideoxygalactose transaminase